MWSADVRQWHYLRPLSGQRVPRRWVLCDYLALPITDSSAPGGSRLALLAVSIRQAELVDDELVPITQYDLVPGDHLLDALHTCCHGPGCAWVIGWRISGLLELIGWWQEAERGRVSARRPLELCQDHDENHLAGGLPVTQEQVMAQHIDCACAQHMLASPYSALVTTDPPFVASAHWLEQSITIVDSRNYWPETLEEMAVEQRRHLLLRPDATVPWDRCIRWLTGRLDALAERLGQTLVWWRQQAQSTWSATTPGLAWSLWRRRHLADRSVLVHGDRLALTAERLALYGGDCRVNYQGQVASEITPELPPPRRGALPLLTTPCGVASVDVRSMYGSILGSRPLPCRLVAGRLGDHRLDQVECSGPAGGVACVRLRTDQPLWPCRVDRDTLVPLVWPGCDPYRVPLHQPHRVIYPVGQFDTVLAGEDLAQALLLHAVERVYWWCEYECEPIGSSYAHWLHQVRTEADDDGTPWLSRWAKLLTNSLIGRWAAWSLRWEDCPGAEAVEPWGSWICVDAEHGELRNRRALAGRVQEQRPAGEAENSMPALTAFVTAAGRWRMHHLRQRLGDTDWYYQDTDGLLLRGDRVGDLVPADSQQTLALGQVQLRDWRTALTVIGKRCYWYGGQWVVSGAQHAGWDSAREEWVSEVTDGAATVLHRGPGRGVLVRTQRRIPRRGEVGQHVRPDGWCEPYEVRPRER